MRELEDRHWWYRSLRSLVRDRLGPARRVLDAGCGTGGMLACLPDRECVGVDISGEAVALAKGRGLRRVCRGSVEELPFRSGSFDAVLLLDVLYHEGVTDDRKALSECARVMRPGAILLLHAPAYEWLRGEHDRAVHGARRYTAPRIGRLVREAGLEVASLGYRNLPVLPFAAAHRLLRRAISPAGSDGPPESDLRPVAGWLDGAMYTVSRIENRLAGFHTLPAGLSVWCAARRPEGTWQN